MSLAIEHLDLRVNGRGFEEVTRRFAMEDGYPGGRPEILVRDAELGEILITRDCILELRDNRLAAQPNDDQFRRISLSELVILVEQAISEYEATPEAIAA